MAQEGEANGFLNYLFSNVITDILMHVYCLTKENWLSSSFED